MVHLLAGDIGGTKTMLRLVRLEDADVGADALQQVIAERRYRSADFPDLAPMIREFLKESKAGEAIVLEAACFAVAGPVLRNACRVTNLPWVLEGDRLRSELGIPDVRLINDFVAVGCGVPALGPGDLRTLQAGEPDREAPIAVVGAGTGLGQGFLTPCDGGYRAFDSEGGHVDFAPRSQREFELLSYLRDSLQIPRVSVERVVSGVGIASIYEFLRGRDPAAETRKMATVFAGWKREVGRAEKSVDLAAAISQAALEGDDYLAQETMDIFIEAYGVEAGNMALKLLPYGGLYLAGGIVTKILPLMENGRFLEAFRAKGRMRPLMERVPVHVILNPKAGLLGAAREAAGLAARRRSGAVRR